MDRFWKKVEKYNRKLIPFALVFLLVIIIIELFVHVKSHVLELAIKIVDYVIITIFLIDLIFLAIHSKNARFFFKNYWLDILAVFPFSLVFNIVDRIYRSFAIAEQLAVSQAILHESLEAEKVIAKEGKLFEAEKLISKEGKLIEAEKLIAKESRVVRYLRIIPRSLRVITKSKFFNTFAERYHHKKKKKKKQKNNK
ncbi:hypothetical protein HYX12_01985 [Candidatus Woesearchaeota archaeon]|nr:hypothetical protein [Candidatus Woesearchaeota archaeon]